jgi:hypothetical protein
MVKMVVKLVANPSVKSLREILLRVYGHAAPNIPMVTVMNLYPAIADHALRLALPAKINAKIEVVAMPGDACPEAAAVKVPFAENPVAAMAVMKAETLVIVRALTATTKAPYLLMPLQEQPVSVPFWLPM